MEIEKILPKDIEARSMELIEMELGDCSHLSAEEKLVVKRAIHTSADFDYLTNLKFKNDGVKRGLEALKKGAVIVTDTQMGLAGISKVALKTLGATAVCFMSDEDVAKKAKEMGCTRAVVSMDKACELYQDRPIIFAIGNAPTALIRLCQLMDDGKLNPDLIIGAPVGFVNIIVSKEMVMERDVPSIVAAGRKGGSNVAAAICNALLYQLYDRETGKVK